MFAVMDTMSLVVILIIEEVFEGEMQLELQS